MFVISDKVEKKDMCPSYETLAEEKPDDVVAKDSTTSEPVERDNKERVIYEFKTTLSLGWIILVGALCFLAVWASKNYIFDTQNAASSSSLVSPIDAHLLAMATINENKVIVEAIRQENVLMADRNKQAATTFVNEIQNGLKKRVELSVKKISQVILDRVQDVENELAVFERTISTLVDGIVDVTKHSIADIKSSVTKVSTSNDTSVLSDAIKKVEIEINQQMTDFDQMFTYQGAHINDVMYQKAQGIMDRIRMILVSDRKIFRNAGWQHVAFCYNISKQNYDISSNLEVVLDAINKLRSTINTMDVLSSASVVGRENNPADETVGASRYALETALNNTKVEFKNMMNTDDNFLGTILKEMAYEKHIEMRDFIYKSYKTVMMSVLPAIEKVTRNFKVVKDSHWQQITKVIDPELADLGKLIQTKASLITDDLREKSSIVKDSEFKSIYTLMKDRFQNVSSTVNSLLQTKQGYMIEGFSLTLVVNMDEQLPLIATWSLRNYIPSDACPMSVEFQTYLKGTMEQYLSLKVIPDILEQAFELDAEFEYAEDEDEQETDSEDANDNQLSATIDEIDGASDLGGFVGAVMSMINSALSSAGLTLDGPVEVYIDESGEKKRK